MAVISGGTTLIDNGALDPAVPSGSLILLSTQTASASASISFTSDIDSTYDSYVFKFIDIHPATNSVRLTFNLSTDGGSTYNVTKTTTAFRSYHNEDDSSSGLIYFTDDDLAQSTAFSPLTAYIGSDNDQCCSGTLQIFNPSSTTFVKHFILTANSNQASDFSPFTVENFIAGYGNTTSAVDAIQFKFESGNIDDGIIKMYGVK